MPPITLTGSLTRTLMLALLWLVYSSPSAEPATALARTASDADLE